MFRFHKPLDTVTLFHKASSPASVRVLALLKRASAHATETATEDQASDHSTHAQLQQQTREFDLNVTEDPPTPDQLKTILDYIGKPAIPSVVKGAKTETEALKKFRENAENFQRPVVVDWNNGRATAGHNESQILKMLSELESANK